MTLHDTAFQPHVNSKARGLRVRLIKDYLVYALLEGKGCSVEFTFRL